MSAFRPLATKLKTSQEVVEAIAHVPSDSATNMPKTPVKILKVTFKREGPVPPGATDGVAPEKKTDARAPAAKKK